MRTQHPCRVCGNRQKGQINRHHLLPKYVRDGGTRQITIKLCRDGFGCRVHKRFHEGEHRAAIQIRQVLEQTQIQWMVEQVGSEWVRTIYPSK